MADNGDIFAAIRDDHETQRTLVDLLIKTEGDSDGRNELFDHLRTELESHAGAEERFFYVPLLEHDETQESARHSIAEHHEIDELISKLEEYDMSGSHWLPTAEELHHKVKHHLDEEETEIFPVAGRALSEREKQELASQYQGDMARRRAGE